MHLLVHRHSKKRNDFHLENDEATLRRLYFLDKLTLVVGILGPLTDIPQIYKIITARSAAGVSELAWGGAAIFDLPFLIYGIVHKDKVITTTYSLWLIGNILILLATFVYSH